MNTAKNSADLSIGKRAHLLCVALCILCMHNFHPELAVCEKQLVVGHHKGHYM
jgi:hypothetical protein